MTAPRPGIGCYANHKRRRAEPDLGHWGMNAVGWSVMLFLPLNVKRCYIHAECTIDTGEGRG